MNVAFLLSWTLPSFRRCMELKKRVPILIVSNKRDWNHHIYIFFEQKVSQNFDVDLQNG